MAADTAFVKEQKTQLTNSVIHNNRLKTLESYKGYLGDLGLGGFVIPANASQLYFDMVGAIFHNNSATPSDLGLTTAPIAITVPTAIDTALAVDPNH